MNVDVRFELCLPAVLDAANILIRDTCPQYSKTYLADGDYHHGNRIKRLAPIPSDGKREARGISVIRFAFTSLVQISLNVVFLLTLHFAMKAVISVCRTNSEWSSGRIPN